MRLVSALLFVALTGSVTLADEAKPADPKPEVARQRVPLRVVRMLPETHQVLLLHKNKGTHVVAEVGQDIDGYIIDEIDDDEVTLVAPNGAEVILTAPDMTWRRKQAERKAAEAKHAATGAAMTDAAAQAPAVNAPKGEAVPEDPYAEPAPAGGSVASAPAGEVRVVSADGASASSVSATGSSANGAGASAPAAHSTTVPTTVVPADPYADPSAGITAFAEAVGAEPPQSAPTTKAAPTAPPAPPKAATDATSAEVAGTLAAAVTGEPAPKANTFTVSRSEVDAALNDFGMTAITFDAKFVAEGLRIDAIAAGTLLEKAGLKKGDTITSVDGKPLRSFDDAADLYARMQTAKRTRVAVQRAGKPVTLDVSIR